MPPGYQGENAPQLSATILVKKKTCPFPAPIKTRGVNVSVSALMVTHSNAVSARFDVQVHVRKKCDVFVVDAVAFDVIAKLQIAFIEALVVPRIV